MDVRWYFFAVAWVTVTESLSWADGGIEDLQRRRQLGLQGRVHLRRWSRPCCSVSTDVVSSAPLYSGMMLIAPFSICG